MLHAKIIDLSKEKIKPENAEEFIASSKFGASIVFYGTVRENNENQKVTGITYDSHDQLVIKSFKEIYNEADQKLNIKEKSVFIEHVKGYVGLGEISIIIAVACPHRSEAYDLSRFIIEEIKKNEDVSLFEAVRLSLNEVIGAYAIVVMQKGIENQLIVARKGSPLVIGLGNEEFFIASDATPIVEYTRDVVYLGEGEIAVVNKNQNLEIMIISYYFVSYY